MPSKVYSVDNWFFLLLMTFVFRCYIFTIFRWFICTLSVKFRRECEISSRSVLRLTSLEAAVLCSVVQSCLTPYDPVDCRPQGSSVRGILQARVVEWVAISSTRGQAAEVTRIRPELLHTYTNKRLGGNIYTYTYIHTHIHIRMYIHVYLYVSQRFMLCFHFLSWLLL